MSMKNYVHPKSVHGNKRGDSKVTYVGHGVEKNSKQKSVYQNSQDDVHKNDNQDHKNVGKSMKNKKLQNQQTSTAS